MQSLLHSFRVPGSSHDGARSLSATRFIAPALLCLCIASVIFGVFSYSGVGNDVKTTQLTSFAPANDSVVPPEGTGKGRFHLWIPATQSNEQLCKLLVSSQILDYPAPTLINWGMQHGKDDTTTHLAKIQGFIDYLDALEANSDPTDHNLVLIVDGYDVWFQLRRDVLIERYYELNAAADRRTIADYGRELFEKYDMRQTVIFGPDKICWPIDWGRPACWAAPHAPMSKYAYGPGTQNGKAEYNHPVWLNSGTIIGPARHLRDLFNATLYGIHANYEKHKNEIYRNSDQYYLSDVWEVQEYARLEKKPELMAQYMGNEKRRRPELSLKHTEYHIGIDHESSITQTLAFWKPYLVWMQANSSWPALNRQTNVGIDDTHQFQLQADVRRSEPPFAALRGNSSIGAEHLPKSWAEVPLLYNTVTQNAGAIIHMTAEKQFRHIWWPELWFHKHAEKLRVAAVEAFGKREGTAQEPSKEIIGGYRWYNAGPPEAENVKYHGRDGAWSDTSNWLTWRGLCEEHADKVYNTSDQHYYHSRPKKGFEHIT